MRTVRSNKFTFVSWLCLAGVITGITGVVSGQQITSEIYRLSDNYYYDHPDAKLFDFSGGSYQSIVGLELNLLRYTTGEFEIEELATIELHAGYPGILDDAPFEKKLKDETSSLGGNLVAVLSKRVYRDSEAFSAFTARACRITREWDGQPVKYFLFLPRASTFPTSRLDWGRDEDLAVLLRNAVNTEKLHSCAFSKMLRESFRRALAQIGMVIENKEFCYAAKAGQQGYRQRKPVSLDDMKLKLDDDFFKKIDGEIQILKRQYPEEYAKFQELYKLVYPESKEEKMQSKDADIRAKVKIGNLFFRILQY